ncbi:MAG: hypothetical protein ABEH38_10345 [Flavobacteriales bacterium]
MNKEGKERTMDAPDRSVPPPVHDIERVGLKAPDLQHLSNGIPVYEVHGGTEHAVRVEFMFQSGIGRCCERGP